MLITKKQQKKEKHNIISYVMLRVCVDECVWWGKRRTNEYKTRSKKRQTKQTCYDFQTTHINSNFK